MVLHVHKVDVGDVTEHRLQHLVSVEGSISSDLNKSFCSLTEGLKDKKKKN